MNKNILGDFQIYISVPLSQIPLVGLLFLKRYKTNEKVNKFFLLAGDKFVPEMYLR